MEGVDSPIPCNCKYSKCLKLYCECFANGEYCKNCNCSSCENTPDNETMRLRKIQDILKRDPLAFRPKISKDPLTAINKAAVHFKGCICKKTKCNKKYCECFNAGISCSELCKCTHCKNKQVEKKGPENIFQHFRALTQGLNKYKEDEGRSEESTLTEEFDNYERFEKDLYENLCRLLKANLSNQSNNI